MMKKVIILMSTYNGELYLREQLDSILAQTYENIETLIRDDGSTDSTIKILDEYKQKEAHISFYQGENLKPAKSFFDLLKKAPNADFYAFCDQDDLWMLDKIYKAIHTLEKYDPQTPLLYFCNRILVNENLRQIAPPSSRFLNITKGNSLIESPAPGCTMVFNTALKNIVKQHLPMGPVYHDRWLFLTATFMGKVIYDNQPYIKYRQHGGNVIGGVAEQDKPHTLNRIMKPSNFSISDTAELFMNSYYASLSEADRQLIKNVIKYKTSIYARVHILLSSDFKLMYGNLLRNIYWKIRILLKKI